MKNKKRKARKITIYRKDGSVEIVKPGVFQKKGKRLKRSGYGNYLQSSHWKQIRAQAKMRDKHRCVGCGSRERLQVHHLTYARLGQERLSDLTTLCRSCHRSLHRRALHG